MWVCPICVSVCPICVSVPNVCLSHMCVCPICVSVPHVCLSHYLLHMCVFPNVFYTSHPRRARKRPPKAAYLRVEVVFFCYFTYFWKSIHYEGMKQLYSDFLNIFLHLMRDFLFYCLYSWPPIYQTCFISNASVLREFFLKEQDMYFPFHKHCVQ